MDEIRLSPTSYVVLGLIEQLGRATSYDLKQASALGVSHFWSLPHTQLYSEPARLADGGYLDEDREETGRRRHIYRLTRTGHAALDMWRSEVTSELYEIRDAGILKLFFGTDPTALAEAQLKAHELKLRLFEDIDEKLSSAQSPEGVRLALHAGIGHEREYIRFWSRLRNGELSWGARPAK